MKLYSQPFVFAWDVSLSLYQSSHDLGPIYVGQTVKTYFKLLQSTHNITTLQVVGSNDLSLNSCNIKYQHELIQTSSNHNHGCNE